MKQLDPHEVKIGENIYYIRPLPAMKAAHMSAELGALAGPLLAGITPIISAVGTEQGEKSLFDLGADEMIPAISGAFSSLDGNRLEELLRHLLIEGRNISVEIPGEKVQLLTEDLLNEIFCEDVQNMFVLAYNVIKLNYKGFFKKLGDLFGQLTQTQTTMESPR